MKIKFVKGYVVKGDAPDLPVYKEGEVYEFVGFSPESYARKYVDRGLAVEYVEPPVVVEGPKSKKAEELPVEVVRPVFSVKAADKPKPVGKFKGL